MTFLGTRKRHLVFWTLVSICALTTKFTTFSELRLTLDSIFSGLLALTGFVFTARTFITFKLNEVIYDSPKYRSYVEKLKEEGAYKQELYDPLKSIDSSLGVATYMCLWATILFIAVAFLPAMKEPLAISSKVKAENVLQLLTQIDLNQFMGRHDVQLSLICKVFTDVTMMYFGFCLYQMILTARALHKNISDIVSHWEAEYKTPPRPGE